MPFFENIPVLDAPESVRDLGPRDPSAGAWPGRGGRDGGGGVAHASWRRGAPQPSCWAESAQPSWGAGDEGVLGGPHSSGTLAHGSSGAGGACRCPPGSSHTV
ncbi:hypothetical protein [Streptomyces bluensis]|uniref:hypothetical protein n=1 Tax=Streptomyces bluensis TaxID=33897 RepID=UPI0033325999